MKQKKKILLTAMSTVLVGSLTAGVSMLAFADTATKDREYTSKYDAIFENFDRADISATTKVTAGNVNLGEKPYLHVSYTAGSSASPEASILKQGAGSLNQVAISSAGTITFSMRAPDADVDLEDLIFAVRCPEYDDDAKVVTKTFAELRDSAMLSMPDLTDDWQDYEISFANTYEDSDKYDGGKGTAVTKSNLAAFHLYAAADAAGTIEIASVSYTTTGEAQLLNNFIGGDNVQETGKLTDDTTWWAGSAEGYIAKRTATMSPNSEFTVVKDEAVGNYKYAVIEAEGDVAKLTVATTEDGKNWGTSAAYDGYSVVLTGAEKGFKFAYSGSESVVIKRIFLTNLEEDKASTAVPVIDGQTLNLLEDFNVSQTGFTGNYDDMVAMPQMEKAGLFYRLSYSNGDKVAVEGGNLVFDATNLDGYINYKFLSKTAGHGKYVILKVKAEGGATLDDFRFALGSVDSLEREVWGDVIYKHQFKSSLGLPMAGIDESNPYKTDDGWYYLVIDIAESGFKASDTGYSGMDMYYSGAGKLYVNCVIFADEVPLVFGGEKAEISEDIKIDFTPTAEGYEYAGYLGALTGQMGKGYNVLGMDITVAEGTDLSGVRLEIVEAAAGGGERWFGANDAGSLYLMDGTLLANAGFVAGEAKRVYIDLAKSGLSDVCDYHVHSNGTGTGAFKIENLCLYEYVHLAELTKALDTESAATSDAVIDFNPTAEGYQYAGYIGALDDKAGKGYNVLAMDITIGEGTDLSCVRFEITVDAAGGGERWFGANDAGSLYLLDGTLLADAGFVAGETKTVYIDLAKSGLSDVCNYHVHSNGTGTGAFKIENVTAYKNTAKEQIAAAYETQLAALENKAPAYKDDINPTVTINNETTATAGDEITVSYTATDNLTATENLTVVVTVTKDGNAVTLNGNKFTAEEGVYTVTVTATDENGNVDEATIQITVSASSDKKSGCSGSASMSIVGAVSLLTVGGMLLITRVIRKKKEN